MELTFEPKFTIGDSVYFIHNDGIAIGEIVSIGARIEIENNQPKRSIIYGLMIDYNNTIVKSEELIYKTLDDLFGAIRKSIEATSAVIKEIRKNYTVVGDHKLPIDFPLV